MNPPPLPTRSSRDAIMWIWIIVGTILAAFALLMVFAVETYKPGDHSGAAESSAIPSCITVRSTYWDDSKSKILGELANFCDETLASVHIDFTVFDSSGAQIQSTLDSTQNLEHGNAWRFEAPVWAHGAQSFKISKITAIPQ